MLIYDILVWFLFLIHYVSTKIGKVLSGQNMLMPGYILNKIIL